MKSSVEKLNIVFVKMIEKYPCIWDPSSENYRNKVMVREAWNKISKAIDEPSKYKIGRDYLLSSQLKMINTRSILIVIMSTTILVTRPSRLNLLTLIYF